MNLVKFLLELDHEFMFVVGIPFMVGCPVLTDGMRDRQGSKRYGKYGTEVNFRDYAERSLVDAP